MGKKLLLTTILLFAAVSYATAESIDLGTTGADLNVTVQESDDFRTVIRYEIGSFDRDVVKIDGKNFYQLSLGQENNLLRTGEPSLPRINRSIIIPDDARMDVKILQADYIEFENMPIAPSKGEIPRTILPSDVPYTFGPIYGENAFYPGPVADIGEPFIFRDYRGSVVQFNCFQYNPVTQTLRVYRSLTVEIVAAGPGEINVFDRRKSEINLVDEFNRIYRNNFINYNQVNSRFPMIPEVGDMLIITYDSFHASMMPLVEWKLQKGIKTTIVDVSTMGNNSTSIKSFISDFYDTTNLAFVLLVGDGPQIDAPYSNGDSDPSYGKLLGSDNYPEILIGRFSAENTSHVETQVLRSVNYEKTPFGIDWYNKGIGVASNQGPGDDNEYDDEHLDNIRLLLLAYGFTYVDQIYDPYGTASQVSAAFNDGRSWSNYTGHGSTTSWSTTGFSNTHVNALTNDWMLPVIISVACVNGNYVSTTCFAEAWLRATNGGNPTGALATYMSTINQDWDEPMEGQDAVNDYLVTEEKTTVGGLLLNGGCRMLETYPSAGVDDFDTWTIFGDPSVQVRVKNPQTMTVNHDAAIIFTMTEMDVEVVGLKGALCALYYDGTLYGSGYTDASGNATITLSQNLPVGVAVTLTVTAYHMTPYIATVQSIAPDGPFVVYDENQINDASGNNDGLVNCGESIGLGVQLMNVGPDTAFNVTAVLSSSDGNVTITDNTENYNFIAGDFGSVYIADAFAFDLYDFTPNEHIISFNLEITGDDGAGFDTTWQASFTIPVYCFPDVEFTPADLVDSLYLGTSTIDTLTIVNNGKAPLTISFSESDSWFDIDNAEQTVDPYSSLEMEVGIFTSTLTYGNYTGYLNYTSNDPISPSGSVPIYLHIFSPDINIPVTSIEQQVIYQGTASSDFIIQNNGPGPLEYQIARLMFDGKSRITVPQASHGDPIGFREIDAEKSPGETEPYFAPVTRGSGGPDMWGYSWVDSDDPDGPTYGWVDISGVGTAIDSLGDDDTTGVISIGFDFPFYENFYNELYISSNGILTFGVPSKVRTNTALPNGAVPNNMISMWWDDLDPRKGGNIYYYHDVANDRFIVSFVEIRNYYSTTGTGMLSFQAILNSDGKIQLQYGTMDPGSDAAGLAGATIGIENATGDDGLEVVFNAEYMHDNLAILLNAASWLSVEPASGSLDPYTADTVSVNFEAGELGEGDYNGQLIVASNDPDTPEWNVPVTMSVIGAAPPGAPSLLSPANLAIDVSQPIMFDWSDVGTADMYQLQIDSNSTFTSKTLDSSMTITQCEVSGLVEGMTYYWRVRAHNAVDWGNWSDICSFTTEITWICGDVNNDGDINIFDVTALISFLYQGGPPPTFMDAADVNNDGDVNIFDATYLISFLYQGGPAPNCP